MPSKALVFGDLGGRVVGEQRSARLTEKDDACASRDCSASRRLDISPSPSDHIPTAVRPLSELVEGVRNVTASAPFAS